MRKIFIILGFLSIITPKAHAVPAQWAVNGHYYEYISVGGAVYWEDAKVAAEFLGGYLATVTSAAEDDWIWQNVAHNQYLHAWLGGFQPQGSPEPDGGWSWVTGETWAYSNWYLPNGEPNNYPFNDPNGESVLELGRFINQPRYWNDMDPHTINCVDNCVPGYIIEWNSDPDVPTVSEPSTLALLGCSLTGAFLRRRSSCRQKSSKAHVGKR